MFEDHGDDKAIACRRACSRLRYIHKDARRSALRIDPIRYQPPDKSGRAWVLLPTIFYLQSSRTITNLLQQLTPRIQIRVAVAHRTRCTPYSSYEHPSFNSGL